VPGILRFLERLELASRDKQDMTPDEFRKTNDAIAIKELLLCDAWEFIDDQRHRGARLAVFLPDISA
jgi:hypothetical protein